MTPSPPRDLPNVSLDQVSLTPSQTDGPEPTLERTCMPILGWYFAFVINPKASLGFLGNDQVAKFISRRQTYIAYLDSMEGIPFPDMPSFGVTIHLISKGPALEAAGCAMVPHMAVAVTPNNRMVQDRPPLSVVPPLPWNNVYHAAIQDGAIERDVRVSNRVVDCHHHHKLSFDERLRHRGYIGEDLQAFDIWLENHTTPTLGMASVPVPSVLRTVSPETPPLNTHMLDPSLGFNDEACNSSGNLEADSSSIGIYVLDITKGSLAPEYQLSDNSEDKRDESIAQDLRTDSASGPKVSGDPPGDDLQDKAVFNCDEHIKEPVLADTIQDILENQEDKLELDAYATIIDITTYDLRTVEHFGRPEQFYKELLELEQLHIEYRDSLQKAHDKHLCAAEKQVIQPRFRSVPLATTTNAAEGPSTDEIRSWQTMDRDTSPLRSSPYPPAPLLFPDPIFATVTTLAHTRNPRRAMSLPADTRTMSDVRLEQARAWFAEEREFKAFATRFHLGGYGHVSADDCEGGLSYVYEEPDWTKRLASARPVIIRRTSTLSDMLGAVNPHATLVNAKETAEPAIASPVHAESRVEEKGRSIPLRSSTLDSDRKRRLRDIEDASPVFKHYEKAADERHSDAKRVKVDH